MAKSHILFDLDGTLTDSQEGILKCFSHALEKMGLTCPEIETLGWCVGPPLRDSFRKLLGAEHEHRVEEAAAFYRERYSVSGLFENLVYDGIHELLDALREKGKILYVATAKPQIYAQRILEHFELADRFARIYGSQLDGRLSKKTELIEHILKNERLHPSECVMVGDRDFDMIGAKLNGIVGVGAGWGYGSFEELNGAGATHYCRTPGEILELGF